MRRARRKFPFIASAKKFTDGGRQVPIDLRMGLQRLNKFGGGQLVRRKLEGRNDIMPHDPGNFHNQRPIFSPATQCFQARRASTSGGVTTTGFGRRSHR